MSNSSSGRVGPAAGRTPADGSDDIAFVCWVVRQTITLAFGGAQFVNVLLCAWPALREDRGLPEGFYHAFLLGTFALSMASAFLTMGALHLALRRAAGTWQSWGRRRYRSTTPDLPKADGTAWAN